MTKSQTAQLIDMIWDVAINGKEYRKFIPGISYDTLKYEAMMTRFADVDKQLDRLVKAGFITDKIIKGNVRRLFLTKKCLAFMIERCVLLSQAKRQNKSGLELCILSSDVPQKLAGQRRQLSNLLDKLGFKRVHRTTWVGQIESVAHLRILLRIKGYTPFIHIYQGRDVTSA